MHKVNSKANNVKTIIDVAKIAGVSKSTVSRALTNDPKIKKETKDKILKIIDRYNFFPNYLARSLRTTFTHSIGVIVGDINNPFYFDVIRGIENATNEKNFNILLESTAYDCLKELLDLKTLISKKIDGILICTTYYNPDIIPLLIKAKIPEDISIFGNDDIPLARYLMPPLTTIFQPKYEMGEIATKILLDKINNKSSKNHIIELKSQIIERESVISI